MSSINPRTSSDSAVASRLAADSRQLRNSTAARILSGGSVFNHCLVLSRARESRHVGTRSIPLYVGVP